MEEIKKELEDNFALYNKDAGRYYLNDSLALDLLLKFIEQKLIEARIEENERWAEIFIMNDFEDRIKELKNT